MFKVDFSDIFGSPANFFLVVAGVVILWSFIPVLGILAALGLAFWFIKERWG